MRGQFLISLGIAAAVGLLVALYGAKGTPQSFGEFALGIMSRSMYAVPFWVAEENGYFAAEGLAVRLKEYESGQQTLEALLANEVDVAAHSPLPFVEAAFRRDNVVLLASYARAFDSVEALSDASRGITSVKDLAGKRVGLTKGTASEYVFGLLLAEGRLAASGMTIVDLPPSRLPDALASGEVDAVIVWEPHGGAVRELLGSRAIELGELEKHQETFLISARREFTEGELRKAQAFLRALRRAETFIQQNGEVAKAIAARRLGDERLVAERWGQFDFQLGLGQDLLTVFSEQAHWLLDRKAPVACCFRSETGKEVPEFLDRIAIEPLYAVRPEAVTIIH